MSVANAAADEKRVQVYGDSAGNTQYTPHTSIENDGREDRRITGISMVIPIAGEAGAERGIEVSTSASAFFFGVSPPTEGATVDADRAPTILYRESKEVDTATGSNSLSVTGDRVDVNVLWEVGTEIHIHYNNTYTSGGTFFVTIYYNEL